MADYPTVLLFDGPTRLGTLRVDNPTTVGHVLKVAGTSPLSVEWGAGGGGGGGGDFVGPASSTDNAVVRFDGTTGKLGQNSTVIIDDSGNMSGVGTLSLGTALTVANGGTGSTSASGARTNLGLVIGTDVQAYNANLAAVAAGTWTGSTSIITLGTILTGTWSASTIAVGKGGTGATTQSGARTNLGVAIGSDVQAWSARLDGLAGTAYGSADLVPYTTASNTFSTMTVTAFARTILDDVDAAAVRTTIGAGTGSGDVVGPGSASDNHLARYDGRPGNSSKTARFT